jgi:hypothetical protein
VIGKVIGMGNERHVIAGQSMDVEVMGAGKRLFGGEPVPDGCVGIAFAFGAELVDGSRAEVVRLVKDGPGMLQFLERLHAAVMDELADRARRVRAEASRGPLTPEAADRLLREGGFMPDAAMRALGDPGSGLTRKGL